MLKISQAEAETPFYDLIDADTFISSGSWLKGIAIAIAELDAKRKELRHS